MSWEYQTGGAFVKYNPPKLLSYSEITLMLFRTLPVAPGCNKVPEKEKTSGNHYNFIV
jgi:hypothetical protein